MSGTHATVEVPRSWRRSVAEVAVRAGTACLVVYLLSFVTG